MSIRIGVSVDVWRTGSKSFDFALDEAKRLGFSDVELCGTNGEELLCELGFMPYINIKEDPLDAMEKVRARRLRASNLTVGFALMGPKAHRSLDFVMNAIRFAAEAGIPIVNTYEGHRETPGATEDETIAEIVHNARRLAAYGERRGVAVTLEPHGPYSTNLERLHRIVEGVRSKWFGVNLDTGNTYIAGGDPAEYLETLYGSVKMFHVKDVAPQLSKSTRGKSTGIAVSAVPVGGGVNAKNIRRCIEILKKRRWSGTLIVETEGSDLARRSLAWLKRALK
jgi:sugar phosphate isomerase/epimerase